VPKETLPRPANWLAATYLCAHESASTPALIDWKYDCCERCANYLFDRAQPVLAFCATLACFLYLWKCSASFSFKKSLRAATLGVTSFLGYFVYIGTNIYLRTECTALCSPGPEFLHSVIIGGPVVALVLLIESAFWSLICVILLLLLGAVSRVFRPAEPFAPLSIKFDG
jgi:hypothetical protein